MPAGRLLLYFVLALLAFFVLSTTFILKSGGGSTAAVAHVTMHELRTSPQRYRGQVVTTEGILRMSVEHGLREVTDETGLAILIRGNAGSEDLDRLQGSPVRVTGRFGFDAEHGIFIDAQAVVPVE